MIRIVRDKPRCESCGKLFKRTFKDWVFPRVVVGRHFGLIKHHSRLNFCSDCWREIRNEAMKHVSDKRQALGYGDDILT